MDLADRNEALEAETERYRVQLSVYEGPLDLLLELIERAELDITIVSLAAVTDQYLAYLQAKPAYDLADLSSFLVIAARLIQIKSEALLPRPPARAVGEEDPGEALARQLIAYRKYKQIARLLAERQQAGLHTHLRMAPPPRLEPKVDLSELTAEDLHAAYVEALKSSRSEAAFERVAEAPRIRIRDKIQLILSSLRTMGETTFGAILHKGRSRIEIVVSFLAVLELIKQKRVTAQQDELFGEIHLLPGESWGEAQDSDFDLEFEG